MSHLYPDSFLYGWKNPVVFGPEASEVRVKYRAVTVDVAYRTCGAGEVRFRAVESGYSARGAVSGTG